MSISDTVVANLTTIYLTVIVAMKGYGLLSGQTFSGLLVLSTSTAVVGAALLGSLTWDVSRKATYALSQYQHHHEEVCRGGICWHGVAVKSPASEVKFRVRLPVPQQQQPLPGLWCEVVEWKRERVSQMEGY